MGKKKKRGKWTAKAVSVSQPGGGTGRVPAQGLHHLDPMGASWRSYPRSSDRKNIVDRLKAKPEEGRTGDEWWQLGEYQVLDGLSTGDEAKVNSGSQALMKGAHLVPPHAGCLLDLGWLLCYKGLDQMALFYLNLAAESVPNSRDVWSLKGWSAIGAGDRSKAIEDFKKAVALPDATSMDRKILDDLERGEDLQRLRKDMIFRKFDDDVIRGRSGDPKEAARSGILQLRQLLERTPNDRDLAYLLAYCYYVLDQFENAEPLLLRVIGEDETNADALTLLGLISMRQKRPEDQRKYYQRAVRENPNHVLANVNLASIYQGDGNFREARPMLERAIASAEEDDPHVPIALDLLGNSYGVLDKDFEEEAELHRQAIALDPKRPLFHSNLIMSLLSAGRIKEAKAALGVAKSAKLMLPNYKLISGLVDVYSNPNLHPYEYMQLIENLAPAMGWPALQTLVKYAWARRSIVPNGEKIDFVNAVGLMASNSDSHELALEIWRYGSEIPGGEVFKENIVVELSHLDRNEEALAAAESMPMNTPRSWTILGNTRQHAGLNNLAIDAYKTALERDEKFLLPIANAINSARQGALSEELEPFIEKLRADWSGSFSATCLLGQALALQGKISSAVDCFRDALWNGAEIRTPEEIWADGQDIEDPSLLGKASISDHYRAALCLLDAREDDLLKALITAVASWPNWNSGDWRVIEAEMLLRAGRLGDVQLVIEQMANQPPPGIVAAKLALAKKDFDEADRIIGLGLTDDSAKDFNHPDGRPDAVFSSLAAERALTNGNPELAEQLASEAIEQDALCLRARAVLVRAIQGRVSSAEREAQIRQGLRRAPGHPTFVAELVRSFVESGDLDGATQELEANRPLLIERHSKAVSHELGEIIAVDRLSTLAVGDGHEEAGAAEWPWVGQIQTPLRAWLRGANISQVRGDELAAAYALYLSKVAEYLLVSKIMVPFKDSVAAVRLEMSARHRDISAFLDGKRPPSIGAIARLMKDAGRSYWSSDDELTVRFREALSSGRFGNARALRSAELLDQLELLGRARNSTAHLGDEDFESMKAATRCVVVDGRPGALLLVLGAV